MEIYSTSGIAERMMRMLKHGILGLLNYGSMSGYEIMQVFRDSLSYFWSAQSSQIYRELQTLKKSGFVTDEPVKGSGGDKKIFTITDAGRAELINWLCSEDGFSTRSGLLMLTFFRGELPAEENIKFFTRLKESALRFGGGLGTPVQKSDFYSAVIDAPEKALYWRMTVEYGIMYTAMLCEWCDKCIAVLEGKEK